MKYSTTDFSQIRQALEDLYFKGIYEGDTNLLKQVYYPGTLFFGVVNGQPYAKTFDQYLEGVKNRLSPKDSGRPFTGNIISIDIVNSIAVARVHFKLYDFYYYEFLAFHKLDNRWTIVNKMIADNHP